jgi:hypothetical protein
VPRGVARCRPGAGSAGHGPRSANTCDVLQRGARGLGLPRCFWAAGPARAAPRVAAAAGAVVVAAAAAVAAVAGTPVPAVLAVVPAEWEEAAEPVAALGAAAAAAAAAAAVVSRKSRHGAWHVMAWGMA